jgi:phosphate transport system protein
MTKHLLRDLDNLRKQVLFLGAIVEGQIMKATTALLARRRELAVQVINGDDEIDRKEVAVEEECLKMLALHQPVAGDLRYIIAVLKVDNDLERMGDLAVNIAERAVALLANQHLSVPKEFATMVEIVRRMVHEVLEALIRSDPALAHRVLESDEEVDSLHRQIFSTLQARAREDPDAIESIISMLSISRHLERIADQATNIAEDVIFMVQGDIVRHKGVRQNDAAT